MNDLDYATLEDVTNAIEENGTATNAYQVLATYRYNEPYETISDSKIVATVERVHATGVVDIPNWDARKKRFGL